MLRYFKDALHISDSDAESMDDNRKSSTPKSGKSPNPRLRRKRCLSWPSRRRTSRRKPKKRRLRGSIVPIAERWTLKMLVELEALHEKSMNQIFAPIPTMCALYAVRIAMPRKKKSGRKSRQEDDELNSQRMHGLRDIIASQPKHPPSTMFSFVKIIVDDEKKTVVSSRLMDKLKDLTQSEVVLSCPPRKVEQFLGSISAGAINGPRFSHGFSTIYAAAGLQARWCGEAKPATSSAFASTYSTRQNHPYFYLETEAKVIHMHQCEILEVPVKAEKTTFGVILIRPIFIGELHNLRRDMEGEDLHDILQGLAETKSKPYKVVLPVFSIKCEEDMLKSWTKNATENSKEIQAIPPIEAIWSAAKFSMNADGIGVKDLGLKKNSTLPISFRSHHKSDYVLQAHAQIHASIDSSFIFLVTEGKIPLLAGCYMGNPPPPKEAFCIPCPEDIIEKPPPKIIKRPKPKLTKKQKKAQKARRVELPYIVTIVNSILQYLNPL
ncbi:unnamed protein product [Cylicocyclus nassatus]|uniref:Uncharacterized protein n=1 Tax=Cylicocyclus nassatus TaxID=53992 RepID=A0AA36GWB8_CYLNA|nr:unnamed protein product [Cylicocyclus nassatus]